MACLKCGKKTSGEQAFCPRCLELMDACPVKTDVHIQLPNRTAAAAPRKTPKKRRSLSPEEQVVFLRSRLRRTAVLAALLLLLLLAVCGLLYLAIAEQWFFNGAFPKLLP